MAGYADIITIGQQAFVGVGAYAFYGLTVLGHISPYAAIPLAAVVTLILAVPAMATVFRLRTAYLAVGTWVAAEVLSLIAGKLPGFGGGSGTSLPIPIAKAFGASLSGRITCFYLMSLGLALAAFAVTWALLRSRVGLGLTAMRDNEEAAGASGVNLDLTRVICFLFTAPILGLAGVLVTLEKLRIAPSASFSITDWTIFVIFIVVIGGIGSLEGPIIGTAVFFLLREYLSDYGTWYLIILGMVSIATILIEPKGLWGGGAGWEIPKSSRSRRKCRASPRQIGTLSAGPPHCHCSANRTPVGNSFAFDCAGFHVRIICAGTKFNATTRSCLEGFS